MTNPFGPLVTTKWLAEHLSDADVKIIDGSWRMPGQPPAKPDYDKRHIEGAVFFDIDAIADRSTSLPHMLPAPSAFEAAVGAKGISEKDRVIVYDDHGVFSAARVWWTFRAMGHEKVAVLDGGLKKWLAEGRAVTDAPSVPIPTSYKASPCMGAARSAAEVQACLEDEAINIIDARPADRFNGKAPEPRAGLRCGHMPGALNVPFGNLLTPEGSMRPASELKSIFAKAGFNKDAHAITTCGSGVTAAVLSLALAIIGHDNNSLYDGSWAEWGDEKNDADAFPVIGES